MQHKKALNAPLIFEIMINIIDFTPIYKYKVKIISHHLQLRISTHGIVDDD
jgi:hypothetical protein